MSAVFRIPAGGNVDADHDPANRPSDNGVRAFMVCGAE
jgi:hypothetical protein